VEQPGQLVKDAFGAEWSPSGETLAFMRTKGQSRSLWTAPASGGMERELISAGVISAARTGVTFDRFQSADLSWAPDSSRIAYCAREGGIANVFAIAADGSQNTKISANVNKDWRTNCPLWSPGGDQIAYVLDSGSKPPLDEQFWELWVWKAGQTTMIFHTKSILRLLGWTEDGELVAALAPNDDLNRVNTKEVTLISISAEDHRSRQLHVLPHTRQSSVRLSPDKRYVAFVAAQNNRENIFLLSLAGGRPRQITRNDDEKQHYSSLVWAPDGKTIYFGKQSMRSVLTLIDNLN
jgi:Tol biopolymer transport system component